MDLSKYEFLQELHYFSQINIGNANHVKKMESKTTRGPVDEKFVAKAKILNTKLQMLQMTGRFPRIWMARRRRDDRVREPICPTIPSEQILIRDNVQLFLARALEDRYGVVLSTKESLLRLLNHPNLVSLVDVVCDKDVVGGDIDYTIWEYCDKGNLSQLLGQNQGTKRASVRSSLLLGD